MRAGDQFRFLRSLAVPGVPQLLVRLAASSDAEAQAVQAVVASLSPHPIAAGRDPGKP